MAGLGGSWRTAEIWAVLVFPPQVLDSLLRRNGPNGPSPSKEILLSCRFVHSLFSHGSCQASITLFLSWTESIVALWRAQGRRVIVLSSQSSPEWAGVLHVSLYIVWTKTGWLVKHFDACLVQFLLFPSLFLFDINIYVYLPCIGNYLKKRPALSLPLSQHSFLVFGSLSTLFVKSCREHRASERQLNTVQFLDK